MKEKIHPNYHTVKVTCNCGETFYTGTTKDVDEIKVEICSKCHPYFTGKTKAASTGGMIDKFNSRLSKVKK